MTLLDEVIEAGGGMERWSRLKRFTLQLSIDGSLFARAGHAGRFKDIVAEGSTETQLVRFAGFAGPDKCGLYQPERVAIEGADGQVLRSWSNPQHSFSDRVEHGVWDELYIVFICGFSIWNILTTPFLLAHPDVKIKELPSWREHDQRWRRLQAVFPPSVLAYPSEQVIYFDEEGLQRRTDHDFLGSRVAEYSSAHQAFSGVVVPTLRRSLNLKPDGGMIAKPSLLDVETFDASFE